MIPEKYYVQAKRQMQYTLLLERITHNIGFYYALQKDMTRVFLGDLLYRVHNGKSYNISVFGKTGSGKSLSAFDIAESTTDNFVEGNIKFDDDQTLQALHSAPPKTTIIRDEQTQSAGEGSGQQEMALANIEATVRILQVNLIYCSPQVKMHNNHYSVEVFWDWHDTRKATALWLYNDNDTSNPLGLVITHMPKLDLTNYNKRKIEFSTTVKEEKIGTSAVIIRNAERFLTSHYCGALKSMSEIETAIKTDHDVFDGNLTLGQIRTIRNMIAMKAREEGVQLFFDEEKRKQIEEKLQKNPRTKGLFKIRGTGGTGR